MWQGIKRWLTYCIVENFREHKIFESHQQTHQGKKLVIFNFTTRSQSMTMLPTILRVK